jgi:peptidoglycan/xylan/chitin deacetylase (PgdA/CDA1 family)
VKGRTVRAIATAVFIGCTGFFIAVRVLIGHPPPIPAVILRTADAHRLLSTAPDARLGRIVQDHLQLRRAADAKLIALTFDDGPYPVQTPLLLDVLGDLKVKATFFLIGNDAEQFPELTSRIERNGHEIADHTLTHPAHFEALSAEQVRAELLGGAEVLERYAHDPAIRTMMRPPHGRFTERTVLAAQAAGFHVILWNEDPGDWRTVPSEALAHDIELHATAPDIVLLHSGRMETTEMLPKVVARFRKAGYTFVTVGELLRRMPPEQIIHPVRHPV